MNAAFSLMPGIPAYLNTSVGLRSGTGSGIGDTLVSLVLRLRASNSGESAHAAQTFTIAYSAPEMLRDLKAVTGLSWNRIGELCGVSRRAVYDWLEGKPIADHNLKRILTTCEVVKNLAFDSPFQVRTFLLYGGATDATPFQLLKNGTYDEFLRVAGSASFTDQEPFVSALDRLDARHDVVHTDLSGKKRGTAARRTSADS